MYSNDAGIIRRVIDLLERLVNFRNGSILSICELIPLCCMQYYITSCLSTSL